MEILGKLQYLKFNKDKYRGLVDSIIQPWDMSYNDLKLYDIIECDYYEKILLPYDDYDLDIMELNPSLYKMINGDYVLNTISIMRLDGEVTHTFEDSYSWKGLIDKYLLTQIYANERGFFNNSKPSWGFEDIINSEIIIDNRDYELDQLI